MLVWAGGSACFFVGEGDLLGAATCAGEGRMLVGGWPCLVVVMSEAPPASNQLTEHSIMSVQQVLLHRQCRISSLTPSPPC